MSSEILYLLDPAQGVCMLEGNISRRVTASSERRPGVARPLRYTSCHQSLSVLANVYLHDVLDQWFERDVKPRMRGEAYLIRYADDFIVGFELESDAVRYQTSTKKLRVKLLDLKRWF